jgi:hypothetical protein
MNWTSPANLAKYNSFVRMIVNNELFVNKTTKNMPYGAVSSTPLQQIPQNKLTDSRLASA